MDRTSVQPQLPPSVSGSLVPPLHTERGPQQHTTPASGGNLSLRELRRFQQMTQWVMLVTVGVGSYDTLHNTLHDAYY